MSDLIDRQSAIDAVTDELDMIDHVPQWVFDRLEKRLKQLPSAQPEPSQVARDIATIIENEQDMRVIERNAQQWIPCSERLPEDSGWYIVTKELDYDTTFVGLEWYDSTNGWKYDNAKCIAWMPLPEPYKGD